MKTVLIVLGVIALILVIAMIVLYFVGKKMQKKQDESQAQMEAASQVATILVIDKKKMKLKDAGLPKIVLDSTPKYSPWFQSSYRKSKSRTKGYVIDL